MGANETDLAWFRFYGRRWLHGTMMLSPADRGIYIGVICLIVENGGPIEADEKVISTRLGINPRTWRASRDRLIAAGKLTHFAIGSQSFHGNERAEREANDSRNYSEQQRERILKRWSKRKKNNDTCDTVEHTGVDTAVIPITNITKNLPTLFSENASSLALPCALEGASASEHLGDESNQKRNGRKPRRPPCGDAACHQRIEDVDPDHQARVAAWAISRGIDLASISQTDIERARELGMLPD